jgi:hypothetical protein
MLVSGLLGSDPIDCWVLIFFFTYFNLHTGITMIRKIQFPQLVLKKIIYLTFNSLWGLIPGVQRLTLFALEKII